MLSLADGRFFYLIDALHGDFVAKSAQEITSIWTHTIHRPVLGIAGLSAFTFLSMSVVCRGVVQGIEWASRWMMPLLFAVLLVLVGFATSMKGFGGGSTFLFHFSWNAVTHQEVLAALGHAFFTLAIGAGCMCVYGAYLDQSTSLVKSVAIIAGLDLLVALLSGLAIFPIIFTHGLTPAQGPGLMYATLPIALAKCHRLLDGGFVLCVATFAAWTSALSMIEPLVWFLMDRYHWSRCRSCVVLFLLVVSLGQLQAYQ